MVVEWVIFVFFFQAEDGIRDGRVTGVQTLCSSDLLRRSVPAKAVPMLAPAPPLPTRAPWRDRPRVRLAGSGHADEPTDAAKPPSVISKPHAKRHRYERAWVCSATANHGVQIKSFCIDQDGHDSHGM